jgi:hypothetical protein
MSLFLLIFCWRFESFSWHPPLGRAFHAILSFYFRIYGKHTPSVSDLEVILDKFWVKHWEYKIINNF